MLVKYLGELIWGQKEMGELRTPKLYSNGLNAIRPDFPLCFVTSLYYAEIKSII